MIKTRECITMQKNKSYWS